jgi:hypothetical protein
MRVISMKIQIMKKRFFLGLMIIGSLAFNQTQAQIRFSLNIGSQPVWGPTGYDHVENYYLPDVQAYYNVQDRQYRYQENGRWVTSASLPGQYRNYNLYTGHKVVINEREPWMRDNVYRSKYASYRNMHDQQAIRDSRDRRYYENKEHPMHNQWKENWKENGHDNRNKNHDKRGRD